MQRPCKILTRRFIAEERNLNYLPGLLSNSLKQQDNQQNNQQHNQQDSPITPLTRILQFRSVPFAYNSATIKRLVRYACETKSLNERNTCLWLVLSHYQNREMYQYCTKRPWEDPYKNKIHPLLLKCYSIVAQQTRFAKVLPGLPTQTHLYHLLFEFKPRLFIVQRAIQSAQCREDVRRCFTMLVQWSASHYPDKLTLIAPLLRRIPCLLQGPVITQLRSTIQSPCLSLSLLPLVHPFWKSYLIVPWKDQFSFSSFPPFHHVLWTFHLLDMEIYSPSHWIRALLLDPKLLYSVTLKELKIIDLTPAVLTHFELMQMAIFADILVHCLEWPIMWQQVVYCWLTHVFKRAQFEDCGLLELLLDRLLDSSKVTPFHYKIVVQFLEWICLLRMKTFIWDISLLSKISQFLQRYDCDNASLKRWLLHQLDRLVERDLCWDTCLDSDQFVVLLQDALNTVKS